MQSIPPESDSQASGTPAVKSKVLVVPTTSKRDVLIGVLLAVFVLGFVIFAILQTGGPQKTNMLRGEIVEKIKTGVKEQEISLGFKKGKLDHTTTDTGYHLKVKVKDKPEPYVVPVEKWMWESKKVGDDLDFLRPNSER